MGSVSSPTILTAELHLGNCAGCPAAINWGYQYVVRYGWKYHVECDPERDPHSCNWCGVNTEYPPITKGGSYSFSTECDPCNDRRQFWLYYSSIPQLAEALYPRTLSRRVKKALVPDGIWPQ
jgi:hypothetical protein